MGGFKGVSSYSKALKEYVEDCVCTATFRTGIYVGDESGGLAGVLVSTHGIFGR